MEKNLGAEIYGIDRWGHEILSVLPNGDAGLKDVLNRDAMPVSIPSIIQDLSERGITRRFCCGLTRFCSPV